MVEISRGWGMMGGVNDIAQNGEGPDFQSLEATLGHVFRRKELLEAALTHPTYAFESGGEDNQRLEFLGDAVVGLCLAAAIHDKFPEAREGELTRLRASLASGEALARKAAELGLGGMLRLGRGQRREGGAKNRHNLADVMEAVLGAIFVDAGYAAALAAFDRLFSADVAALSSVPAGGESPRSTLQMRAARELGAVPAYEITGREGPDSAPTYFAEAKAG
ncbi:MAG: ribonuclease III, partial [Kiritimatiellae bacterium]|nr:ribonuclease III [Kiritimatiellia bacterium]